MKSRQKREEYYAKLMKEIPKTYNEKDATFKNVQKTIVYLFSTSEHWFTIKGGGEFTFCFFKYKKSKGTSKILLSQDFSYVKAAGIFR